MATVTAARAASTFPVYKPHGAGALGYAYGVYEVASALSKADIVEFCLLPPCDVVDGFLSGDEMDTDATETFEMDVGVAGNTDQFLDSGVIPSEPIVANHYPAHGDGDSFRFAFNGMKDGPHNFTAESTTVIGTQTAVAATGGTGTLYCGVYYLSA